jgi:hypothetical protein
LGRYLHVPAKTFSSTLSVNSKNALASSGGIVVEAFLFVAGHLVQPCHPVIHHLFAGSDIDNALFDERAAFFASAAKREQAVNAGQKDRDVFLRQRQGTM